MDQPSLAAHHPEDQSALIAFLGEGAEHIETHAAHVFLKGDFALKLKKAVKLPYLDFSTLALRKGALDHELEINRVFSPDLYLDVKPIVRTSAGGFKIGGRGAVRDWILRMKRFPQKSLLSAVVERGDLDDELVLALAGVVADAHVTAAPRDWDGVGIMAALEAQLFKAFAADADPLGRDEVERFCDLYAAQFRQAKPLLAARAREGAVRRCHGDLHCRNIVVIDGCPTLFDAIEFSERIATCDVLYDLGFLVMDLLRLGERRAASLLLNRYFELRRQEEPLAGLSLMPLFLSTRSGVRAIVASDKSKEVSGEEAQAARAESKGYFDLSLEFLAPRAPRLIAIGGLSGTGKSTLGRSLCPSLEPPPGAIHIRSDIERKVLSGVPETERLGAEAYTKEAAVKVYDAMLARADDALAAGFSVIVDGVFATPQERADVEHLAAVKQTPFMGLWLEADADELRSRVLKRVGDASDATAEVVERQLGYKIGEVSWTRIDASGSADDTLERALRTVLRKGDSLSRD